METIEIIITALVLAASLRYALRALVGPFTAKGKGCSCCPRAGECGKK